MRRPVQLLVFSVLVILGLLAFLYYTQAGRRVSGPPVAIERPRLNTVMPPQEELTVRGIIGLTNEARKEQGGLAPLRENGKLNAIAEARVRDMFEKGYIGHVSPAGEAATDVAHRVGYPYRVLSENIASGFFLNDRKIVEGWMQSPGHRKNILLEGVSEIGVAFMKGSLQGRETLVAVQIFAQPSLPVGEEGKSAGSSEDRRSSCVKPDEALKEAIDREKKELADLAEKAKRLRGEIDEKAKELEAHGMGQGARGYPRTRDPARATLMEEHNGKVHEHNRLVNTLTLRQEELEKAVHQYNEEVRRYNDCLGR